MVKKLRLTLTYQGGLSLLHEGHDTQPIDVGEVGAAQAMEEPGKNATRSITS